MAPRSPKASDDKPAKSRAAKAKPGPATGTPPLKVVEAGPQDAETPAARGGDTAAAPGKGATIKLKDLIDSVASATGNRKPEVKAVVEATLTALGAALASGKALSAPPLGKLRVVKTKGAALTLKLRLADAPKAAGLALADEEEDS